MLESFNLLAELAPWQQSLLTWLGYDFSDVPTNARPELIWTNRPDSWGVFVLIAVVAGVLYAVFSIYRRELDTCPRSVKLLLAALRAGVVLLLACIFLGPALVYLKNRTIQPTIVLARDSSQSMNTPDRYTDEPAAKIASEALRKREGEIRTSRPTRVQIVNDVLGYGGGQLLEQLGERGKIQTINFADQVTKIDLRQPKSPEDAAKGEGGSDQASGAGDGPPGEEPIVAVPLLPPLVADGRGSDLAMAIRQALASDSPAAIILLTDGQHTGKDDPREAAREAKERGVPLLVVGVGDASRPRNLKVANLYVRPQVWQDEPFEIDAIVTAQGMEAGEVRIELLEQRVGDNDAAIGSGTVVQSLQLPVPEGGGRLRAEFSHTAKESGRFVYTVRTEAAADELAEDDNELTSAVVKVLSRERVRVLLVAGAPSWDYRLVQKLLARDKTVIISCWLQTLDEERAQEGTRQITRLPITREELFYYDVVILMDPNPQEFDQAWIELLKQFVGEHSGGLLFMAGPKHSGRLLTNSRTAELGKILPVSFGDVAAMEIAQITSTNQRAWPLKVVPANVDHPVMRFYPEREETLRRWETLPGIYWSFPTNDTKPTAEVLVEHSDPTLRQTEGSRPLMVAGRYGSGHTLYLGFNGTWRWRKAGRQAEFFDKFWIQTIRYLVEGRSLEGRRRGYVQTDRDRYEIGEKVTITARLQDATYNPLTLPKVDATLQTPGDSPETVPLLPIENQPGAYEATLTVKKTGVHTVRITLPASDAESGIIESPFTVELPSVETNQVWLNKPLLVDLANQSGGQYFDVNQLDQLAAAVPDKTEIIESRGPPDPLWDVRGMLIALVGLLCIEWLVRKRNKLL
ncbi:MAG TPA: VWA domain-containing protein [Pirellulaceae bacterium]|nr:VWA domain-containing protein [Pirellulaceae bacterium]